MSTKRVPPVRQCIAEMEEYIPISTPEALALKLGLRPDQIIKLDGNENPYGCSPKVPQALAEADSYHRYPDPLQQETRALLAGYVGVPADSLVLGLGSDELIDAVMRLYLEPGDEVIQFPPTFGMYAFSTQICGGKLIQLPRGDNFEIDVDAANRAITDRTRMVFLDSPNNPSGQLTPKADLERLLETGLIVVVDEAYAEFSSSTMVPMVADHPNLVVLRTFSKWAGLAGMRIGYGVFPPEIIRQLWKMKQPYNLSVAGQVAVQASLEDLGLLQERIQKLVVERGRLREQLSHFSFLRVWPSEANFLLCDVLEGSARELLDFLASRGIILRYFNKPRLTNSIRISVGLPEHTDAIVTALRTWQTKTDEAMSQRH